MKKEKPLIDKVRRRTAVFGLICVASISGTLASCSETIKLSNKNILAQETESSAKFLGGLSPDEALAYMKATPDLYIIDVREPKWYEGHTQFADNAHIPYSKLAERYKEIPTGRPVILNCGMGMVAPHAYELLKKLDIDVMQLSYIAGSPRFLEFNKRISKQKR